jgi:hypothetical protein
MLKHLLSACLFFTATVNQLNAQCVPDPIYADSSFGVWPDTLVNLPCAFADVSGGYSTAINLKTLTDTSVAFSLGGPPTIITASIESFRVNAINGLPPGFAYVPNQAAWTNGGISPDYTSVQGCLSLDASQAAIQAIIASNPQGADYPLTVIVDAKINTTDNSFANFVLAGKWLSELTSVPGIQAIAVEGYVIKVRPSSGNCAPLATAEISMIPFDVHGNFPNPFTRTTEIKFSASRKQQMELQVHNMVGSQIIKKSIDAERGENSIGLNADLLKPGIYFFSLSDGKKTFTRKMIVSAN